jgi:hypothetical protein
MFGRFLRRLRDDMAHVPEVPLIWCRYAILFSFFPLSPPRIQRQPLKNL